MPEKMKSTLLNGRVMSASCRNARPDPNAATPFQRCRVYWLQLRTFGLRLVDEDTTKGGATREAPSSEKERMP